MSAEHCLCAAISGNADSSQILGYPRGDRGSSRTCSESSQGGRYLNLLLPLLPHPGLVTSTDSKFAASCQSKCLKTFLGCIVKRNCGPALVARGLQNLSFRVVTQLPGWHLIAAAIVACVACFDTIPVIQASPVDRTRSCSSHIFATLIQQVKNAFPE